MKPFPLAAIAFTLFTCANREQKQIVESEPLFARLSIDSVLLEPPPFSGKGFFEMNRDTVFFYDEMFGWVLKKQLHSKR